MKNRGAKHLWDEKIATAEIPPWERNKDNNCPDYTPKLLKRIITWMKGE